MDSVATRPSDKDIEAHLAAWASVSPGNNENANRQKTNETRKGSALVAGDYLAAALPSSFWNYAGL
jgi:hypothetical protein